MRRFLSVSLLLGVIATGFAGQLTVMRKYNGTFVWIHIGVMPPAKVKTLANAKNILISVKFPQDVKLKKDAGGNAWFSFVLADIGSDGKWTQAKGGATVPVAGTTVKAGKYILKLPVDGIPKSVLKDPKQFLNVGPNTSGLVAKTDFDVDVVKGQ